VTVQEMNVEQLKEQLDNNKESLLLVDIRSENEVAQGIIKDSIYIPMHLIPLKLSELPKNKKIVLYCRSGVRSYHTCKFLIQEGFDNTVNLQGGIISWARTGYEVSPFSRETD